MKLRDNIQTEKVDIVMYQGLAAMADNKIKKLDEELIPTFIIEEALSYFCNIEKYEICQKIKTFFKEHSSYVINSTRDEWYGVMQSKKQRH